MLFTKNLSHKILLHFSLKIFCLFGSVAALLCKCLKILQAWYWSHLKGLRRMVPLKRNFPLYPQIFTEVFSSFQIIWSKKKVQDAGAVFKRPQLGLTPLYLRCWMRVSFFFCCRTKMAFLCWTLRSETCFLVSEDGLASSQLIAPRGGRICRNQHPSFP